MPAHQRALYLLFLLLLSLLAVLWLMLEIQSQSASLSLMQSFLLLGGAALGFLVIGIEGLRLALNSRNEPRIAGSFLAIFLVGFVFPAVLLALPGWLSASASGTLANWWVNPLPSFTWILQCAVAGFLILFRFTPLTARWIQALIPRRPQAYLWLVSSVCGMGVSLVYQYFLTLYQPGFSFFLSLVSKETGIVLTQLSPGLASQPLYSSLALLAEAVFLAPLVSTFFFREMVYQDWQKKLGRPAAVGVISGLFAFLHFQPMVFLPAFLMMLIFFELDRLTDHPFPGFLAHALVNLLAIWIDWRWIV
jgi:membrane protease YdiL (CAAX protease family)